MLTVRCYKWGKLLFRGFEPNSSSKVSQSCSVRASSVLEKHASKGKGRGLGLKLSFHQLDLEQFPDLSVLDLSHLQNWNDDNPVPISKMKN